MLKKLIGSLLGVWVAVCSLCFVSPPLLGHSALGAANALMDREDDCESAADMEGEHEDRGGDEGDYKLREDLIRELESRAAASPVKFSDIYQSKIIPTVEADKLLAFGVPVLDDFYVLNDSVELQGHSST